MASRSLGSGEPRLGLITFSVVLATFMQALDTSIANVALPHMQGSFSATLDRISWILTSYIVASAIVTPLSGFLASRYGRKRTLVWSLVGFTTASVLCGAAASLPQMVLFRLLQGAFGASLIPLSLSVMLDTHPPEKHGPALATWGAGAMLAPILGPTVGAYLTDLLNWRWVFYINLPLGIVALTGILASVPENERDPGRRLDLFGFALLGMGIGALQMMLDRGESQNWFGSTEILVEAALSGLCLYMFVVHTLTHERPFLPLGIFKDRNFLVGIVMVFAVGVILYANYALLPTFLQSLLGYPVVTAGYVLAPRGVGNVLAALIVGRIANKADLRLVILFGLGLTAYSLWLMGGFNLQVTAEQIAWTGFLQGFGLGFVFSPMNLIAFSTLAPHYRNDASSVFNLLRYTGASIGISAVVALLSRNTQANHALIGESVTPFNQALREPGLSPLWDMNTSAGLAALEGEVSRQAAALAYVADFRLLMAVSLLALPLLLLVGRTRRMAAAAATSVTE